MCYYYTWNSFIHVQFDLELASYFDELKPIENAVESL